MSKSRAEKSDLLSRYKNLLESSKGYILVETSNLDTATITKFKMDLAEVGATYEVVKNSVFKIALTEQKQPVETQVFDGATAVIAYSDEPTAAAKLIKKLREESKADVKPMDAKLGTLDGAYITAEQVMELADIPSRDVLLAKMLGSLNAPLTGIMNTFTGNIRGFTMVLKQLSEK